MSSTETPEKVNYDWSMVIRPAADDERACDGYHHHRIQWYNDHSNVYNGIHYDQRYMGPFYTAMTTAKFLEGRTDVKILDIGGGTGFGPIELKKLGNFTDIDVVDPAEKMVNVATDQGLYNKTYIQFFENDCGIPAEEYDVVVSTGAFAPGHLKANSVAEMFRVLKPGGLLVLGLRNWYMETDPDIATLPDEFEKRVKDGTSSWLERSHVPKWNDGMPGTIFAYRKS